jgi:serine protease Do
MIARIAREFVLLRILDMRGIDLNVFDFDYDLTWAGFFLSTDGFVYGRYGSRDAGTAERELSLAGLKYAMERALAEHRRVEERATAGAGASARTVEQYAESKRVEASACIHCHQVYDFRRFDLIAAKKWRAEQVWVYPRPENVGLTLEPRQGDLLREVQPASVAERAGLQAGDRLVAIGSRPIASIADVAYALHRAPAVGKIQVIWQRDKRTLSAELPLREGWRETDISWRASTRRLGPHPCVQGDDLSEKEKQALGLESKRLAFRQGSFPSLAARQAGICQNDIILGIDGKTLKMTAAQFGIYIRLNYHVGDDVTFNILRANKRLDVVVKLPELARY